MYSSPTGAHSLSVNAILPRTLQVSNVVAQSPCGKQGHWFLTNSFSALKDPHLTNEFIN